jgi:hypothetical protein
MTRTQALKAITSYAAAGQLDMATRIYCEHQISRKAFDEAVAKGQRLATFVNSNHA